MSKNNGQMDLPQDGMSLRDYFAGQALAGLVVSVGQNVVDHSSAEIFAKEAYLLADAMIKLKEAAE